MDGRRLTLQKIEAIRELKNAKATDMEIAEVLGLTVHQVHYIRSLHGIGSRYANYKEEHEEG